MDTMSTAELLSAWNLPHLIDAFEGIDLHLISVDDNRLPQIITDPNDFARFCINFTKWQNYYHYNTNQHVHNQPGAGTNVLQHCNYLPSSNTLTELTPVSVVHDTHSSHLLMPGPSSSTDLPVDYVPHVNSQVFNESATVCDSNQKQLTSVNNSTNNIDNNNELHVHNQSEAGTDVLQNCNFLPSSNTLTELTSGPVVHDTRSSHLLMPGPSSSTDLPVNSVPHVNSKVFNESATVCDPNQKQLTSVNNSTNNIDNNNELQPSIINISTNNIESTNNNDNNDEDEDAGEIITEQDILDLKLEEHLNTTTEGSAFLIARDENKPFDNKMKSRLTRFIIAYELDKAKKKFGPNLSISQFDINAKQFLTYTKAIVKIFPKERRSSYYIPYQADADGDKSGPKGKLYSHYNFKLGKLRKDHVLKDTGRPPDTDNCDQPPLDNTSDSTDKLGWLQNNSEPINTVQSYWSACFEERRKLLMQHRLSVQEYLAKFLCLQSNIGHLLLAHDFQQLFPGKENHLFKNWPLIKQKLLQKLRESRKARSSSDQVLLDSLAIIDPAKQDAVFLHLLPLLMSTAYVKIPSSEKTGDTGEPSIKKKRIITKRRATLQESRDGLFIIVPTVANLDRIIDEKREQLQALNLSLQPISVIIGTLREVEDVYVLVDNHKYRVSNVLTAVDLTFKITEALDCKYPEAALNSWLFIRAGCYDIPMKTKHFSQSVQDLVCFVKNEFTT